MTVEQPKEIKVFERGEVLRPLESSVTTFALRIETHDPTAQIVVLDDRFETKATAAGSLATTLPAGIYKIRIRRGASSLGFEDRSVVLDRDRNLSIDPPKLFSPAPFGGTQASRAHVAAREWLDAVVNVKLGKGAKIALLARYSPTQDREPLLHPFHGVKLHRVDEQLLLDLEQAAPKPHVPDTNDPISICGIAVAPGAYILRHQLANGRMLSQSVIASEGWQITINIRRSKQDITVDGKEFAGAGYCAVLMRRLMDDQSARPAAMIRSSSGYISEDQLVDVARQGLADGNQLLAGDLYDLLLRNVENPLAGIFGGLLLDIERQAAGEKFDREHAQLFDVVVQRLRTMVGRAHPDVEALSFRCEGRSLARTGPIEVRPMFHRCWRILLEAAAIRRDLVPLGLWKSTSVSGSMPPYFIWSISKEAQDTRLQHFRLAAAQFSTKPRVEGTEIGPAQAASIAPATPSRSAIAAELGLPVNALAELLDPPKRQDDRDGHAKRRPKAARSKTRPRSRSSQEKPKRG